MKVVKFSLSVVFSFIAIKTIAAAAIPAPAETNCKRTLTSAVL
jgi:hypothetical protein